MGIHAHGSAARPHLCKSFDKEISRGKPRTFLCGLEYEVWTAGGLALQHPRNSGCAACARDREDPKALYSLFLCVVSLFGTCDASCVTSSRAEDCSCLAGTSRLLVLASGGQACWTVAKAS